jgi:hypothetical protein
MARLIHSTDKRVTQKLASGTIIRQDFRTAARFVFFDTGYPQWQFATHGGTIFVVRYKRRPYGLTCRHVLGDFDWRQLIVTDQRHGTQVAGLRSVAYPSRPIDAAVDTDLLDVAVIQFSEDVDAAFFKDPAYVLDEATMTTSRMNDTLHVAGALKSKSEITESTISPTYCLLEMVDDTPFSSDPTLRRAKGKFDRPEFADVVGLSGSPVFNVTQSAVCGMVVRGAMNADVCTLWYIDMFDVAKLLAAVHDDAAETYYLKRMTRIVKN